MGVIEDDVKYTKEELQRLSQLLQEFTDRMRQLRLDTKANPSMQHVRQQVMFGLSEFARFVSQVIENTDVADVSRAELKARLVILEAEIQAVNFGF